MAAVGPSQTDAERTGVLVARAWVEEGALRARLTRVDDVSSGAEQVTVHGSMDSVLQEVESWLEALHGVP